MKIFQHTGLVIAIFWCAAMVVVPIATAAGNGQDMNQVNGPQGIGPGQGMPSGNGPQGGDQNNAGPGQDGRQQGTEMRNMTRSGNLTPPERPSWDPDNSTAMNMTQMHGIRGNMSRFNATGVNMTDLLPRMEWDPANMTAMNQSPWHGNGNMTPPEMPPEQDGGNDRGLQAGQGSQQSENRNGADADLIAELVAWLKDHGIT